MVLVDTKQIYMVVVTAYGLVEIYMKISEWKLDLRLIFSPRGEFTEQLVVGEVNGYETVKKEWLPEPTLLEEVFGLDWTQKVVNLHCFTHNWNIDWAFFIEEIDFIPQQNREVRFT